MIFTFIVSLLLLLWGSFIYFCQCHMLAVLYPSLLYSSSFLIVFFFAGCFLFWILSSLLLSSSLSLFLVLRIVQTAKWRSSFFNSLWFKSIFNFWNLLLFADHVFFFFFLSNNFPIIIFSIARISFFFILSLQNAIFCQHSNYIHVIIINSLETNTWTSFLCVDVLLLPHKHFWTKLLAFD